MRLVGAVALASACGRYEFMPVHDAPRDDGRSSDAALGPFVAPTLVSALSHPLTDDDPTATADALELYFASERIGAAGGYADLYVTRRATRADPWGPPQNVVELNSVDEDQSPGIAPDGLTIYFSSRRPSPLGGTSSNIWMAIRAARTDAWSAPTFVAALSTTLDEFEPQPDESGLRIVLYRQLDAVNRDVFEATRASTSDPWDTPVALANVNGATSDERSPCLRDGGRELWFSSDRDSATANVKDIYRATRANTGVAFDAGTMVNVLASAADDDDPWISSDGRVLVFSTTRDGNPEIYETQR
jgi:Tol biopolymer transport system component